MDNDNGSNNSVDIIYELAKEIFHRQELKWDAIDQKNYFSLAVFGIILTVVATLDITHFSSESKTWLRIFLGVNISFIFCGILCNIRSLRLREVKEGPNIKTLMEGIEKKPSYIRKDPKRTKRAVLSIYYDAIRHNKAVLNKKISLLKTTYTLFLPVSIVLLYLTLILEYFSGG